MVPNINARGHSFKGVTAYLAHDKEADTSARVVWSSTHNLHTDDLEKAAKFMAWTDMNQDFLKAEHGVSSAGRPAEAGNVYHYSLSWSPEEAPTRDQMEAAAHESVQRLGLQDHQYYLVAHDDTNHAHVHVVANLVHPETGKIAGVYQDYKTLDRWSYEYECEHGIRCEDREKKFQAWEQERQAFEENRKDEQRQIITEAYHMSDSGKAFQAALEQYDLTLAQGKRRAFVVVDERGDILALGRAVEGAKTKDVNALLSDVDKEQLPRADDVRAERLPYDRDEKEAEQQAALQDAAQDAAAARVKAEDDARAADYAARAAAYQRRAEKWAQQVTDYREVFERKAAERIQERRDYWQLEQLEADRDAAQQNLDDHSGWIYRYVFRSRHRAAQEQLDNAEENLEQRREALARDIVALYDGRPDTMTVQALRENGYEDLAEDYDELSQLRQQLKDKQLADVDQARENQKQDQLEQERAQLREAIEQFRQHEPEQAEPVQVQENFQEVAAAPELEPGDKLQRDMSADELEAFRDQLAAQMEAKLEEQYEVYYAGDAPSIQQQRPQVSQETEDTADVEEEELQRDMDEAALEAERASISESISDASHGHGFDEGYSSGGGDEPDIEQ